MSESTTEERRERGRSAMLAEHGVLAGATPATVIAIHSTIHLETLEAVAADAAQQSVVGVELPMTRVAHDEMPDVWGVQHIAGG